MAYWTAASDFDAFPAIAGYVDANGIGHESYDAACEYYGADTPAQLEAESRYWAEEEARAFELAELNEALLYDADAAAAILRRSIDVSDLIDECPF